MSINKTMAVAFEDVDNQVEEMSAEADDQKSPDVAPEAIEEATEIDGEGGDIEAATGDVETLEKIKEVMEESVEKGEGLDPTAAEISEVAIEAITKRLGLPSRIMPATESFGGSSSKLVSTEIAIEGIGSAIRSIWEAIKKAIMSFWDKIVGFFNKMVGSMDSLLRYNKQLLARVKKVPVSASITNDNIDNKSLAESLGIGDKADSSTVKAKLKKAGSDVRMMKNGIDAMTEDESTWDGALDKKGMYEMMAKEIPAIPDTSLAAGYIVTHTPGDSETLVQIKVEKGDSDVTASEVVALSKTETKSILDLTGQTIAAVKKQLTNTKSSKRAKQIKSILQKGEEAMKKVESEADSEDEGVNEARATKVKNIGSAMQIQRKLLVMAGKFDVGIVKVNIAVIKDVQKFCSMCIGNLKVEKDG